MADYITRELLNKFFETGESASDPKKDFAITSASRLFDRLAERGADYFADTDVFALGVPEDVQVAVVQLAISILRESDPVAIQMANGGQAKTGRIPDSVKVTAETYKPSVAADSVFELGQNMSSIQWF